MIKLQWGHGDEAVEEAAAMYVSERPSWLQWGHGDEAVEDARSPTSRHAARLRFNGATAMKPWKSDQRWHDR